MAELTPREREVAALVAAQGLSTRLAARQLRISERTVGAHMQAIYAKTGLSNRVQLLNWLDGQPAN